MKVNLSKYINRGDSSFDVTDHVVCELNGAAVEVRQSSDGKAMIVIIREGAVSMEPRAAGIWIVVKGKP